jgi:hypothetical protein
MFRVVLTDALPLPLSPDGAQSHSPLPPQWVIISLSNFVISNNDYFQNNAAMLQMTYEQWMKTEVRFYSSVHCALLKPPHLKSKNFCL